jgi:hypothetical protein
VRTPDTLTAVKPLQAVGMGLVIVLLTAPVHGYDLLADPLGWLLALTGLRVLDVPQRGTLLGLAWLAFVVSCVLWVPSVPARLDDLDPSLTWSANLPQLLTTIVLAHCLAEQALLADDRRARGWLLTARSVLVLVTVLPVIVFGGGLDGLVGATYVAASLALLLLVWLLFTYASRPWALPGDPNARPPAPDEPGRAVP